jgi:hypothetical protein
MNDPDPFAPPKNPPNAVTSNLPLKKFITWSFAMVELLLLTAYIWFWLKFNRIFWAMGYEPQGDQAFLLSYGGIFLFIIFLAAPWIVSKRIRRYKIFLEIGIHVSVIFISLAVIRALLLECSWELTNVLNTLK